MRNENDRQSGPSSDEEAWQQLRRRLSQVWQEYGRTVVVTGAAVAVVLIGYNAYRRRMQEDRSATWQALASLPDPASYAMMSPQDAEKQRQQVIERCRQILEARWESSATPWVLLRLANAQLDAGRGEEAMVTYRRLMKEYPESTAAETARPALAGALEEMGRYEEAAELYRELAEEQDPTHWMDVARNLELAGRVEEAAKCYRKVTESTESSSELAQAAEYRLTYLKRGEALSVPPPPPEEKTEQQEEQKEAAGDEAPGRGETEQKPEKAEPPQDETQESPDARDARPAQEQ